MTGKDKVITDALSRVGQDCDELCRDLL